jgi:ferredoxin-NADP reductase
MSETKVSRRNRGEDAIYFATAKNRYVGSVSLGYGPDGKRIRRKVSGKTVCGPEPFQDAVEEILPRLGMPAEHVHTERFNFV